MLLIGSSQVLAQDVPRDGHLHWMADIEGPVVDEQGSAIVYEFKFQETGTVTVYKHMTIEKLEQTFDFEMVDRDVKIIGDSNGPVGELAGQTIRYVDDTKHVFKFVDGKTDIFVKKSYPLFNWLHIAFLFVLMFVGNELARHYKVAPYLMFIVLPILLTPLWMDAGMGWFRIAKLYSVLLGAIMITFYRFNFGLKDHKWLAYIIIFFLGFNIAEACLQDWSQRDLPNMLNAFAGILNISAMLLYWSTIRIGSEKPHDMLWPGLTIAWIICYDLWNVTFVYLNFPNTVAYTMIAVIPAPTIAAIFIARGTWLQARAYTLAIYMIYVVTSSMWDPDLSFTTPLPRNDVVVWTLVGLSLGANILYVLFYYRYKFTKKAPKKINVGQYVTNTN
jgi:hypothetical protein